MPLIENPTILDKALDLVKTAQAPSSQDDSAMRDLLNRQGATMENAANNLAELAQSSRNESTRLRATETILKLHGVSLKDDETNGVNITFVVHGDNMKMQNILIPKG